MKLQPQMNTDRHGLLDRAYLCLPVSICGSTQNDEKVGGCALHLLPSPTSRLV